MNKFFTKEVKIAIVVIVAATLLVFGINFLKGRNLMTPTNYYNISYTNVSGLALSAPVNIEGFKIGLVHDISYDVNTGKINVEIGVEDGIKITKGTTAELASDLLGTATISLHIDRTSTDYFAPGDTIPSAINEGMMSSIEDELVPQITNMLPKLDSILNGINNIVNNQAINSSLERINNITADLEKSTGELSKLMQTSVPSLVSNIDTASQNIKDITAQLNEAELQKIVSSADSTLNNIKQLTDKMNDKNSTIGMLFNDSGMYDGIVDALKSADSLLIDLREHPKRYVHFSLFGKKDK